MPESSATRLTVVRDRIAADPSATDASDGVSDDAFDGTLVEPVAFQLLRASRDVTRREPAVVAVFGVARAPLDVAQQQCARAPCRRLSVIPMTNATKDVSDREQSLYR